MSTSQGKFPESLPQNIVTQVVRALTELAETTLWGKANKQTILALNDVKNWFSELPANYKKKIVLAAMIKMETATGVRVYQGVFDKKLNCFLARQLLVEEISKDLADLFGQEEVVIFIEDPKSIGAIL